MTSQQINSVQEVINFCNDEYYQDFFIWLGFARSSKYIMYHEDAKIFTVINAIDDSEQELTAEELYSESNIGEAIENGRFYKYIYE